ncbi:MAG: hypothetical protein O3A00_19720 [Planctomycetota bacterium]|nr:hypothetical protein [Planctomycetota bacterium]
MGATGFSLRYIELASLLELKIAAGRTKDKADVIELVRANRKQAETVREHLQAVHESYAAEFDSLLDEADSK